jgi:hypothetical protein
MDSNNNEEGIPGTGRGGAAPVSTPGQYVHETPNSSYQHAAVAFHAPGWYNGFILPPVHQFPQLATPNEIPSNRGKCPRMGNGICDLHLLQLLERYEQELRDDYNALLARIEALEATWGIARGRGKEAATAVEDAKSKRIPVLEVIEAPGYMAASHSLTFLPTGVQNQIT